MSSEDTKPFACTACVQRKVKCDKRQPCLACSRSRLQCKYRSPPPPQRRKRKAENSNQALLERLRSHEAILRNAGLPFETFDDLNDGEDGHDAVRSEAVENPSTLSLPASIATVQRPRIAKQTSLPRRGILISEYGGRRYYDHGLIAVLGQEYKQDPINFGNHQRLRDSPRFGTNGSQQEASDMLASILLPSPSAQAGLQYEHPPAASIIKYWSIFVDNIHPLTKVIHAPTMRQVMVNGTSDTPKKTDALQYSIFACAVASLTDKECEKIFGDSQTSLLYAFQSATRYMLLESSVLRVPDLDLLRANMLLLTSMLHNSDSSSLWVLMGSAIRMAQSQGLHRDGAALGLSPFEIEMRRRLWWYIVTLDARLSELMGLESALPKSVDTLLPSNINDSDLEPDMTTLPQERTGASEMTFCLLNYHVARFLLDHDSRTGGCELPQSNNRMGKQGENLRSISDLESFLEEKFLRFCDPVVGVQFLTTTMARSTICKLRQVAHHRRPRPSPDEARTKTSKESNTALDIARRNIEYDNLVHSSKALRGFLWHINFYFPWGAPILALRDLASRSEWDDDLEAAWEQIGELYEHHPEYTDTDKVMHLIVGGLTLKAWAAREAALESKGVNRQPAPAFIVALQARQVAFSSRQNDSGTEMMRLAGEETNFINVNDFDFASATSYDIVDSMFEEVDWSNWQG